MTGAGRWGAEGIEGRRCPESGAPGMKRESSPLRSPLSLQPKSSRFGESWAPSNTCIWDQMPSPGLVRAQRLRGGSAFEQGPAGIVQRR